MYKTFPVEKNLLLLPVRTIADSTIHLPSHQQHWTFDHEKQSFTVATLALLDDTLDTDGNVYFLLLLIA